jgi:hypothetical protein
MARTFIRQDDQIAASNTSDGGYGDAVAPSLANYQTAPADLLDDLNNVRSMISYLKDIQAGNWYDVQTAPSSLEAGTLRGVDSLNVGLHAVEKKRVMREVYQLVDMAVPANAFATGVLTLSANVAPGNTVTTGTKTYTFTSPLGGSPGDVLIGATASDSIDNLVAAINLAAGAGTLYNAGTTANGFVSAAAGAGDTMDATALLGGTVGNTIATTEVGATTTWGFATLTGGAGDVKIYAAPDLPTMTTAAVGAVTSLGTIVAAHGGTFGQHAMSAVAGSNAVNPKNLINVISSATHDPLFSSGRVIWGLLQTENATDGHTMTGSTPNRAQVSFVRISSTGDTLEACPSIDIAGQTVHLSYRERKRLEDLNEQDFLKGAVLDIAAAPSVMRQHVYNNQGVLPVELGNNASLDLGIGIYWEIRDVLNATLLRITEGSGGGTTEVKLNGDVDTLNVDAVVNDFATGVRANTSGTRPIRVGSTDGVVETTAGDLKLKGFGQLAFDDQWLLASTYDTDFVLADSSAEWNDFETKFGEVSLLNAIVQASNASLHDKIYAIVTVTNVAADTDVSLADGNVDTAFGAMSAGSFVDDYDVYLNGVLLRGGANAAANNDYYPGTSLTPNAQLRFEFALHGTGSKPDVLCVVKWA